MRAIVNYIRQCFCKHEWQFLKEVSVFPDAFSDMPYKSRQIYRCKKCGYVQKVKL